MKRFITTALSIQLLFGSAFAQTKPSTSVASVDSYLEQVKKGNPSYEAADLNEQSAKLRRGQGSLITLPQIELEARTGVDEKPTYTPNINGKSAEQDVYSVALVQKTPFGLNAKLGYNQTRTEIKGASAQFVPNPEYYTGTPSLELSQSLWRNGFGSETRAERDALSSSVEAQLYAEKYKKEAILVESKIAYYNLYYSRKILEAVKNTLGVSTQLKDWSYKRLKQELADESDYLQTKANNEIREIELATAVENEKAASRAFNSLRGYDSDVVNDTLTEPRIPSYVKKAALDNWRNDVRAAQKQADIARAQAQLEKEKANPNLELFGKYALASQNVDESTAQQDAFGDNHPSYMVGIRFSASLAAGLSNRVRDGYNKELMTSSLNFKRKAQEQERDYNQLISKIETTQTKLKLSQSLEDSQKGKVLNERKRQKSGRTTLFQVLQFEQDYLNAQLSKIQNEAELLSLLTQLELYSSGN